MMSMKKLKYLLINVWFVNWVFPLSLVAQPQYGNNTLLSPEPWAPTSVDETVFVYTDKPYYLTGETLWFSAYCMRPSTGKFSQLSRVLYLELFNHESQAVVQLKVLIQSGISEGQILLPTSMSTGVYLLRAYTAWMRNGEHHNFYKQTIRILNPLIGLDTNNPFITINPDVVKRKAVDAGKKNKISFIRLFTDQENYSTRQQVLLEIAASRGPGTMSLSVSVYPFHQPVECDSSIHSGPLEKNPGRLSDKKVNYFPESVGPIIYGRHDVDQRTTRDLMVSAGGDHARIYQAISLGAGRFACQMASNLDYSSLYFWSIQPVKPDVKLESSFDQRMPQPVTDGFLLDSTTIEFVERQSVNMQISNLYQQFNQIHGVQPKDTSLGEIFYGQPEFRYYLDDYTRFPSLEEVLREYIRYVALRKKEGKLNFYVWDHYGNLQSIANNIFFDQPALVMLDGIPVNDPQWLIQQDPLKIKAIDIVTKKYFVQDQVFHGMVNFKSYNQEFLSLEFPGFIEKVQVDPPKHSLNFYHPQYNSNQENRIPDRRNTLYWNPRVELDEGDKLKLNFFTADSGGKYKIVVRGLDASGQAVYGSKMITVP